MNASAFDAAVHSCLGFFGVAGAHAVSESIPALTPSQVAAVFLIAFGRAVLSYLDAHPVAAALADEISPGAEQHSSRRALQDTDAASQKAGDEVTSPGTEEHSSRRALQDTDAASQRAGDEVTSPGTEEHSSRRALQDTDAATKAPLTAHSL